MVKLKFSRTLCIFSSLRCLTSLQQSFSQFVYRMSGNSKLLFKALISFHSIVAFSFLISCFLHFYFDHFMYQTYSYILSLLRMECIKKIKVQFKTFPVSTMLGRKVKKPGRVNLLLQCIALVETGCLTWDVPGMSEFKHQLEFSSSS